MLGWKHRFELAKQMVIQLSEKCKQLEIQNKSITIQSDKLYSLCDIAAKYHILSVAQAEEIVFAVAMDFVPETSFEECRTIYLFELPVSNQKYWCGWKAKMELRLKPNCRAFIIDWHANPPNKGYGSILMKHVILFLRSAGFRTVTGEISAVDFGHEDLLRHFYSKFGFQITDHADKRSLRLELFSKENRLLSVDSCTVCCRSPRHDLLVCDQLIDNN